MSTCPPGDCSEHSSERQAGSDRSIADADAAFVERTRQRRARRGLRLIEIPHKTRGIARTLVSWFLFFTVFAVLIACLTPLLGLISTGQLSGLIIGLTIGVLASIALGLYPLTASLRAKRAVRRRFAAESETPVPQLLEGIFRSRPRFSRMSAIEEAVRLLPQYGKYGWVIRIGAKPIGTPINPVQVDFEARMLNETDSGFAELYNAVYAEQDTESPGSSKARTLALTGPLQLIWRNITLKGGKLKLVLFSLFLLRSLYASYARGALTLGAIFWLVVFICFLVWPATADALGEKWYLLPGSLFVRYMGSKNSGEAHLFRRKRSALALYEYSPNRWEVTVASEAASYKTAATRREVELLLRTWLSRKKAPNAEVLREFL